MKCKQCGNTTENKVNGDYYKLCVYHLKQAAEYSRRTREKNKPTCNCGIKIVRKNSLTNEFNSRCTKCHENAVLEVKRKYFS